MRASSSWSLVALAIAWVPAHLAAQTFTDVTEAAGFHYAHGYVDSLVAPDGSFDEARHFAGGVAAGDYDNDGWTDLYAVRGDIGPNLLFHNRGDGSFEEVGAAAGVALAGAAGAGPTFADFDGDGWVDLLVGGVHGTPVTVFRNRRDGTFEDVTAAAGIHTTRDTYSAAFADYDRDGDLDLALTHWDVPLFAGESSETLWRNDGTGRFEDVSVTAGVTAALLGTAGFVFDYTFTPNFADIDNDGWPDLLLAADIGTSRVLRNRGDGTFVDITDRQVITDENGMGAAIGDYDGDGILDWFVSSIWDPNGAAEEKWGASGNRLYRGHGDGTFEDVTSVAGVRQGFWGWASTWVDIDNDGRLDLFHVNGFGRSADYAPSREFFEDPSRLFISNGDGTFTERSSEMGLTDRGMGRGAVAFDYDHDGDVDLFVANSGGTPRLFRNDGGNARHWLTVILHGPALNTQAIGARVGVTANGLTQMRELRAGSNFESQDPPEAHFGLGAAALAERVHVLWPDGSVTTLTDVTADQRLRIAFPATPTATPSASSTATPTLTATPTQSAPPCIGDCDGNGSVTIDELLTGVRIALNEMALDACSRFDGNHDQTVSIDEILAAVGAALTGCPASPHDPEKKAG